MAVRRFRRELVACVLITVFGTSAIAQSLGDLARREREKKISAAQNGTAKRPTFTNIDNPTPQAMRSNVRVAHKPALEKQPELQIDSPSDGTVVNPGQTIDVRVSSLTDKKVTSVAVIGQNPLPLTRPA